MTSSKSLNNSSELGKVSGNTSPALNGEIAAAHQEVARLVQQGQHFLITCHLVPDADAIGSMLGLGAVLRNLGKKVTMFSADGVPPTLRFLAGADEIVTQLPGSAEKSSAEKSSAEKSSAEKSSAEKLDAMFIVDTAAKALLAEEVQALTQRMTTITVDHHVMFEAFANFDIRDTDACATGIVVMNLAKEWGLIKVPASAAEPLYTSIVADTGGFRFAGTSPQLLRTAADLLEDGVNPTQVARQVFEEWPVQRLTLLARVIDSLQLLLDGRLALFGISSDIVRRAGATEAMLEGLVNYGRMLKGVEVSCLLWERMPRPNSRDAGIKVSLRSSAKVDVSKVARALGGGGHRAAAGAVIPTTLDNASQLVIEQVTRALSGTA